MKLAVILVALSQSRHLGESGTHRLDFDSWKPEPDLHTKSAGSDCTSKKIFKYKTYLSCETFKDCYAMALSTIALIKQEQEIRFR